MRPPGSGLAHEEAEERHEGSSPRPLGPPPVGGSGPSSPHRGTSVRPLLKPGPPGSGSGASSRTCLHPVASQVCGEPGQCKWGLSGSRGPGHISGGYGGQQEPRPGLLSPEPVHDGPVWEVQQDTRRTPRSVRPARPPSGSSGKRGWNGQGPPLLRSHAPWQGNGPQFLRLQRAEPTSDLRTGPHQALTLETPPLLRGRKTQLTEKSNKGHKTQPQFER